MSGTIYVDWNKDGDFGDASEDISSDVKSFKFSRGRDTELDQADVGRCDIVVMDTTGKYISENSSSPIVSAYGAIYPVCPVRIDWTLAGVGTETLFYGFLDDCLPNPKKSVREAYLPCVDGMDKLAEKISMPLQETKYSGELFTEALDQLGWPVAKRSIDTGLDQYPLVHAEQQECRDFFSDIAKSEIGFFYVNKTGDLAYEDRSYRLSASRCITSQFTLDESSYVDLQPLYSRASIKNYITITAQYKSKAAGAGDLWQLNENKDNTVPDSPALEPGQSYTFWAEFEDIAGDVTAPVATTDYLGNTAVDGSGVDKTAQLTVTCAASDIFAQSAKITVTNNDSAIVYLTMLKIRGKIYTNEPRTIIKDWDNTSITDYGKRELPITLPYYVNVLLMQNYAAYILSIRKDPHLRYAVTIVGSSSTLVEQIITREISDRVTLQNSDFSIDADFYIDKMEVEWQRGGLLKAKWVISKAVDEEYWIVGVSQLGTSTRLSF